MAPVAGVISASQHLLAGQVVEAKEVLFEIVDPGAPCRRGAGLRCRASRKTLVSASALADQTALDLKFVGGGRQLREQALPLLFRITTRDAGGGRRPAGQGDRAHGTGESRARPCRGRR